MMHHEAVSRITDSCTALDEKIALIDKATEKGKDRKKSNYHIQWVCVLYYWVSHNSTGSLKTGWVNLVIALSNNTRYVYSELGI